eukprot:1509189-Rhodomonas_salina.2
MQEQAAGALRNLSVNNENKAKIVAKGALPRLFALVRYAPGPPIAARRSPKCTTLVHFVAQSATTLL